MYFVGNLIYCLLFHRHIALLEIVNYNSN